MTTYTFANALHSLVLRDDMIIFWHPHANTPCERKDGERWLADGSPTPAPFNLDTVGPELKADDAMTGYVDSPARQAIRKEQELHPPIDPDAPPTRPTPRPGARR